MKRLFRFLIRIFLVLLIVPILYVLVSLILSYFIQNEKGNDSKANKHIYISTNGVHLDLVLPNDDLDPQLTQKLVHSEHDRFLSFGWGEKNFYLNTPTWGDLTFSTAFRAAFLKNETLLHVTRYRTTKDHWIRVDLTSHQLQSLNKYILRSMHLTDSGEAVWLEGKGYGEFDEFYQAKGSYSFYNTCNSWVNRGLHESNMPCCLWTPFDFMVMRIYE